MKPEKRQEKLDRIVAAARSQFQRFGYKRTSVEDVARKAHMGKATIYHYVSGKEELFQLYIQRAFEAYLTALETAVSEEASPPDKLLRCAQILVEHHTEAVGSLEIDWNDLEDEFPPIIKTLRRYRAAELAIIQKIIHEGNQTGYFQLDNETLAAGLLQGAFGGMMAEICHTHDNLNGEEVVTFFMKTLLEGLLVRPDAPNLPDAPNVEV